MKYSLNPSWKFLVRNWKSGELQLIAFAIFIAVVCITSMVFLTESIQAGLEDTSGSLLGSDWVITSPKPIEEEIVKKTHHLGLKTTTTVNFLTMLTRKTTDGSFSRHVSKTALKRAMPKYDEELVLAEVQAVGKNYPLRGQLRTAVQLFAKDEIASSIPEKGTVWLEARLFPILGLEIGDEVIIGSAFFKVDRVLTNAPDRTLEGINMAPRVLINEGDLGATKILQPGSRVTYKLLIAGQDENLKQFKNWVTPKLTPTETLIDSRQSRPVLNIALQRTNRYLGLIFLVNVSLSGVAIAMVARRFSLKQFDSVAILRCFGASGWWILKRYLSNLLLLSLIVGALGISVGLSIYNALKSLFLNEMLFELPGLAITIPVIIGLCTVFVLLFGFALPPLLSLQKISPLRVLRKDLDPPNLSNRLVFLFAILAVTFLIMFQTRDVELTGILVLLTLGISSVGLWVIYGLLQWVSRVGQFLIPLQNLGGIRRRGRENALQILAFSLVLTFIGALFLVRTDLLRTWKDQIPFQAPNYFVVNIPPTLLASFKAFLQEGSINSVHLDPVMMGRLVSVNQEPVKMQIDLSNEKQRVFTRLLNLTWSQKLQSDNRVVEGQWFSESDNGKGVISVERGFADRLNIKLGDKLDFQISEKRITAVVTSIRTVEWDSFQPNFYVIFPPKTLENLSRTYITSFYLPPEKINFIKKIVQNFPMVSVIDTQMIVNQLKSFFDTISDLVQYLWGFTLMVSFILLFAAIISTLDERREEAILLRILGAGQRQLLWILLSEFVLLGLLAGTIGGISANGILYWLSQTVFDLPYRINYEVLLLMPVIGMVLVGFGGWAGTRSVFLTPPYRAFR